MRDLSGWMPCRLVPAAALAAAGAGAGAQPAEMLPTVEIAESPVYAVQFPGDTLYTGSALTAEGMALSGAAGRSSVFATLDVLPGVLSEPVDPYGLGASFTRVRGVRSQFLGVSLEGLPNYGIMPIGPRENVYDFENVETVALYKGATPVGLGSASGNRGGTIELRYRRPEAQPGVQVSQGLGSDGYRRSFVRLDSGTLGNDLRAFASYSFTEADKWKGAGDLGPRRHLNLAVAQGLGGDGTRLELFVNAQDFERHEFRGLDFAQAMDIGDNRDVDYNTRRTGNPAEDALFFDYHHQETENLDVFARASISLGEGTLEVKPYYSTEEATLRDGTRDRLRDLDRYGVLAEYRGQAGPVRLTAGYWLESANLEKSMRAMSITTAGRDYAGRWLYLAENDGRGSIHSPYAQVGQTRGRLRWQAGIKYFRYTEPESIAYRSGPGTPGDWEAAWDTNAGRDPALSLDSFTFDAWLPSVGASWLLDPEGTAELYANYGRNYMRPYAFVPVTTIYARNRAAFQGAGLALQDVFDAWEMETSDHVDVGLRWARDGLEFSPTLFYAAHHDLLAVVRDPQVGVDYHQNVGEATAWGAELVASLEMGDGLLAFFHPTYLRFTYEDDLAQGPGTVPLEGNRLPDTPRWQARAGVLYERGAWRVSPVLRWVGERYGDAQNTEEVDGYWTMDLSVAWSRQGPGPLDSLEVGLELTNLFDEAYVGGISTSDDGTGRPEYFAGPPRSALLTVGARF